MCGSSNLSKVETAQGRTEFTIMSVDKNSRLIQADDGVSAQIIVCLECGNAMFFSTEVELKGLK